MRLIHRQTHASYGRRRMSAELRRRAFDVGPFRAGRLMRKAGLTVEVPKPPLYPKSKGSPDAVAPNHLDRRFDAAAPGAVFAGDITYIWTQSGWLYLAVVMDLCARRIVGWAMSDTPDTDLVIRALRLALAHRPPTEQLMFHSDQGCQGGFNRSSQHLEMGGVAWDDHRAGAQSRRGEHFITPEVMISERPAEVADRAVPGHGEGDLIIGLNSSAIGTLVERSSRFVLLLHLPAMPGHSPGARVKNGPALAGHGAEAVRDAIAAKIATLPAELRKSLTWDQGAELSQHAQLRLDTGLAIYFCDPRSPWQRGTNENTNGLLRQYFPKGTDISRYAAHELDAIAATLNRRPRTTLGWKTPAEALDELLSSAQETSVATTP